MIEYLNLKLIDIFEDETLSKDELLKEMVNSIAKVKTIDGEKFYKQILEREKAGTTGIGMGIAVPHARTESLNEIVVSIALLKKPLDFNSLDDEKVKLVILVGAPKNPCKKYLELLSDIARVFRNKSNRDSVFIAKNKEELSEALVEIKECE